MRTLAITALIAAPFMASAQANVEDMGAALSMLETNAQAAFSDCEIDIDPTTLTVAQLAETHAILTSSDISEGDKCNRIEASVGS